MKYPKLRELKEAINSLLSAPYTSRFPKEPHTPFPGFRGKPIVDNEKCVGCLTCSNVCPSHAINVVDEPEKSIRKIVRDYGKCIFCGLCQAYCITGEGVALSDREYDLSTFDRKAENIITSQEKELLTCENCGTIITTKEHLLYLYRKLGPKGYATINNLNVFAHEMFLSKNENIKTQVVDDLQRKDTFNMLCPNCLHKVLLKNILPNE